MNPPKANQNKKRTALKKYNEVIKPSAKSDDGLFKVHKVGYDNFMKFRFNCCKKICYG